MDTEGDQELSTHTPQPDTAPLKGLSQCLLGYSAPTGAAAPGQSMPRVMGGSQSKAKEWGLSENSGAAAWLQAGSKVDLQEVPEGCQLSHRKTWMCFLLCYMTLFGL